MFYKFFIRYFIALILALFVTVNLANIFQNKYVLDTLERSIKDDATLLARTVGAGSDLAMLALDWGASHAGVRLLIFDILHRPIADSQPQAGTAEFATLINAEFRKHHFVASSTMLDGRQILLVGSLPPPFAPTQIPGLIFLIVLILGLVFIAVYPLTRSISETLLGLGRLTREAARGKFGSTLPTTRSDELGSLIRAFNDMSRRLADSEKLNRRLLQDVSHELRSPLTRISVLAETAEHRPDRLNVCLPDIRREVVLLDRLVGDLLDISRFESDTPPLVLSTFPLHEWSRDFLERLEQRAHLASVNCIVTPCDTPISIVADPQRVEQAVGNVFDNALTAIKGRPDTSIRIAVTLERAYWRICVIDNGPGVPAEDLPFIFRRFYRAQSHRSRASGGIGLGLAITKAIVEAHAGTVEFDSHSDGVRVLLSFPIRSAL